jgi:hypothetical protein
MRNLVCLFLIWTSTQVLAQGNWNLGVYIAPSWKINMSKQIQTGLRSSQSGYGFTTGIAVKKEMNDFTSFHTGLLYNYAAFDVFSNGLLVSSFRINSLDLPLLFNSNIKGSWNAMYGAGGVYNMRVRSLDVNLGSDFSNYTNNVQPYLGLGINTKIERADNHILTGLLARYQVLDIWNKDYVALQNFNSHLVSLDFFFTYYF